MTDFNPGSVDINEINMAIAAAVLSLITGFICGVITERVAIKNFMSHVFSASNWNLTVKLMVSTLIVRFLLSFTCIETDWARPFGDQCFISPSGKIDEWTVLKFFVQLISLTVGARFGSALQPIGLTGGIACGKSTVSKILREEDENSFDIIDVDTIAHDVLDPFKMGADSAYERLVEAFGEGILEDVGNKNEVANIDRRKLGAVIFQNPSKRKIINGITHPRIIKIMLKSIVRQNLKLRKLRATRNSSNPSLGCVDIPLLFEGGGFMRMLFGLKITVTCSPELQLERLRKRNPDLTIQQCKDRIASQISINKKVRMSDLVICNDGNMDDLVAEVNRVRKEVINRVKAWSIGIDQLIFCLGTLIVSTHIGRVCFFCLFSHRANQ